MSAPQALAEILRGTGFVADQTSPGQIEILKQHLPQAERPDVLQAAPVRVAAASAAGIESVVVTSSKIKGDIQTVPIAITALSQEQLTSRQIAGGPDLVKEVPNLTFSKTNFTGYNIQIRGIGTQAISVTTDPAVAVALNDMPFIRNHFFEQEFYDVSQVEVLRGPQGTLYGRNATAGVVNVISAKPTDQFEAMASADIGNYHNRRFEGMINVPIVDDRLDIRVAGEWTKRDGYSFNSLTNAPIDGRDLWSSRVTIGWKPVETVQATLVWEHFQEDDDRMRTSKQLCKTAPIPTSVGGIKLTHDQLGGSDAAGDYLSQGCLPTSFYGADAFEVPNGFSLPYYSGLQAADGGIRSGFDVYASTTQSRNLRVIESSLNPIYKAKNDTLELNTDYNITPALTFTSQTGYNQDFLWSTEDYNRFNTAPGVFQYSPQSGLIPDPAAGTNGIPLDSAVFCDPQLGCRDRLVAQDLSDEHAWQLSQEFRLASNFSGPLNFSVGGNYLHYETEENYYVFINTLTQFVSPTPPTLDKIIAHNIACGFRPENVNIPKNYGQCRYIDPNPIATLDNEGHNYFLSQNPYVLNSYAGFGEAYYNVTNDLKLTGGLRWTEDKKHFLDIPSQVLVGGYGYVVTRIVDQQWDQLTGRAAVNWSPKLDFTDQTLIYGSYAHGYKAGGANPPGAIFFEAPLSGSDFATINPIHPLTFKPEFIDAFELGSKNTLLDGALTLNGDAFYYNYKNYQISRIVDRTAINDNFNATVRGAELETTWEAAPGLKFSFAGGYEDATLNKGDHSVDLMDRTAGNPNWMVVKPFITDASNCILPIYVVAAMLQQRGGGGISGACAYAYGGGFDPVTGLPYTPNPTVFSNRGDTIPAGYPGFDPVSPTATNNGAGPAPNNGQGFDKDLSGNQLPNAPHFTTSLTAEYTLPVSEDWAATLHSDFYWQSQSFARVFNDRPYDKLRGYANVNLALILTSADGWQVLGYLKNVFNTTAITGDFLNSDDTGLTTNVFLTDPRLFGVRVTKNF
ncbi:MAG TPA: TonB-dependent receptor [Rhizomicrobium sp.]|nr:TonB-dependent receptor [Rhizomicrobium sp.]